MAAKDIWHLAVTVGTSAITNRDIGRHLKLAERMQLQNDVELYTSSRDQTVGRNRRLYERLIEQHKWFWNRPEPDRKDVKNALQTSAELLSSREIIADLKPKDILLIASDTDKGRFAAELNRDVLRAFYPTIPIEATHLPGLDLRFEGMVEGLRDFIVSRWDDEPEGVAFNVTGGYKGTLLFIMANALKQGWDIYYRHEELSTTLRMNLEAARKIVTLLP